MTVHRAALIHGHPGATDLRVEGDHIVEIGTRLSDPADVVDHGRGVILPGLRDSHLHPLGLAAAADQLDLATAGSMPELLERLRAHAATVPADSPIIAIGVDDERVAERRLPTAAELDTAARDRPVLVYRHCSHVASANTLALAAGGIDRTTSDPAGGRIRRTVSGSPSGILDKIHKNASFIRLMDLKDSIPSHVSKQPCV